MSELPKFDPKEYFNGPIKAWGLIQDRRGNVQTRFEAVMTGGWEGDAGKLEETFTFYENNRVQQRAWNIRKVGDDEYEATAGDVVGTAKGKVHGSDIRWDYVMEVPVGGRVHRFRFEDWTWSMRDGAAINRSYLSKFGIRVAELTVFMQKQ